MAENKIGLPQHYNEFGEPVDFVLSPELATRILELAEETISWFEIDEGGHPLNNAREIIDILTGGK